MSARLLGLVAAVALSGALLGTGAMSAPAAGQEREAETAAEEPKGRIARALDWVARHQMKDGRWSSASFAERCEVGEDEEPCSGAGTLDDLTTTSMALLTFLGSGETHVKGDHTAAVIACLKWLSRQQSRDGHFGAVDAEGALGRHLVSTRTFVELYGLTGSSLAKKRVERALARTIALQRASGAWGTSADDAANTGEALFVLRLARMAELPVPDDVVAKGLRWLASRTDAETGTFDAGAALDPFGAPAATSASAQALLARIWLVEPKHAREDATIPRDAEVLLARVLPFPEVASDANFYDWEMATHALRQAGGPTWDRWRTSMLPALQDGQATEGCARGSFPPVDATAVRGGRVIATVTVCQAEQGGYRYDRVLAED